MMRNHASYYSCIIAANEINQDIILIHFAMSRLLLKLETQQKMVFTIMGVFLIVTSKALKATPLLWHCYRIRIRNVGVSNTIITLPPCGSSPYPSHCLPS